MELKEAKHIVEERKNLLINSSMPDTSLITAIDTILNRLEDLENRYLELIINGNTFKIKNDVKKLQYIDFENNKFTLEVLEKWK